ncbi:N-acetylmuramoyl-L-alanine amidase family protein [Clostridium beijerinckii]|uniref:N-acetylmuramoyl-L-alanine amidase family protein n=1 Tax=Clostridium beijerinckii TaxID=1520 RepID=UPI0022E46FAF|nr:hypothetical protein [Clostridium beijerinckii]
MKRKYIVKTLAVLLIASVLPIMRVSASDTQKLITITNSTGNSDLNGSASGMTNTVRYVNYDGTDLVKITELADAIGEKVIKKNNGLEVYLNDRKVTVNTDTGCAYIDGKQVYDKALDKDGNYVIPKEVVQDKLGILCCYDSIRIYKEKQLDGTVKVESVTNLNGYDYNSGSNTTMNSDGSITTITANGTSITKGNDYDNINDISEKNAESIAKGYTPVYDYDLRDYIDAYIDKWNLSRLEYNQNIVDTATALMNEERSANINEGWHIKDGKYYFLKKGVPITGWYKDVVTWYYFNSDGSMKTGWLNDGKDWYYFYDSGAMARNVCINGYYLNDHGVMTNNKPANAPTGISYQELINRVRSIGYSHKTRYDAYSTGEKSYAAGYEFSWYKNRYVDSLSNISIRDDNTISFSAAHTGDDPDFTGDIHTMLTWLFPTQVNDIYAQINAKAGEAQTIYADGRVIDVSYFQGGINFDIKDE